MNETKTHDQAQHLGDALEPDQSDLVASQPARRAEVVRHIDDPRTGKAQVLERVIVRHSDEVAGLFGAMSKAQGEFITIERTRTSRIQLRGGGGYEHDYETLADVIAATQPALTKHGLACMQFPFPGASSLTLRTMITHESGQWIYNDLTATIAGTDPQAVASGITYLSRYARKAILGIAAEYDDDAVAATSTEGPRAAPRKSEQAQVPQAVPQDVRGAVNAQPVQAVAAEAKRQTSPPTNIGKIASIKIVGNGKLITLETGFFASSRDLDLLNVAERHFQNGDRVELTARPSSDPSKYAPILIEMARHIEKP